MKYNTFGSSCSRRAILVADWRVLYFYMYFNMVEVKVLVFYAFVIQNINVTFFYGLSYLSSGIAPYPCALHREMCLLSPHI